MNEAETRAENIDRRLRAGVPQHQAGGDFSLVHKLHEVLADPYSEQTEAVAALYYKKKEEKFFNLGGTSHCSCSS